MEEEVEEKSVESEAPEKKEEEAPGEKISPARERPAKRGGSPVTLEKSADKCCSPARSDRRRRELSRDRSRKRSSRRDRRRSRSRSRGGRRERRSRTSPRREATRDTRRPREPANPPRWHGGEPTGPPPGIFDQGYSTRSWKSKGLQHRIRNRDIRTYGTDPGRKAARVENFQQRSGR